MNLSWQFYKDLEHIARSAATVLVVGAGAALVVEVIRANDSANKARLAYHNLLMDKAAWEGVPKMPEEERAPQS